MKRKEMIEIIGKWLMLGKTGFDIDIQQQVQGKSLAECILTSIEDAGMSPPERKYWMGDFSPIFKIDHSWEPENEIN